MIAKGTTHSDGPVLARYLITSKGRERAELWELRGFAATGIVTAFRSVHVMAAATRCTSPFFHVSLRNREGETLDRLQWKHAADRIERMLGLTDQPRAIAVHTAKDTGHSHVHIAWSRIDETTLTAKPLPFFKRCLIRASRELEKCFGLTPVRNERESSIRFAPTRAEQEQARRLGLDVHAIRETIRSCFDRSDCGRSFQAALSCEGLVLTRGDRRDYLVVDRAGGGMHALGKRILGVPAAEIRARLSDLPPERLPTVDEARRSILRRRGLKHAASAVTSQNHSVPELGPKPNPTRRARDDLELSPLSPEVEPTDSNVEQARSLPEEECEPVPTAGPARHEFQIPVATPAVPESPAVTTRGERPHRFSNLLRRQFQALVKALTKREPAPQLEARKRRQGETTSAFRSVARNILRPITRLPIVKQAAVFLKGALVWLHLRDWNQNNDGHEASQAPGGRDNDDFSPHF